MAKATTARANVRLTGQGYGRGAAYRTWQRPPYHRSWERRGPGGSPGLQNQWRGARRRAVGSTPMRSRQGGSMAKRADDPGSPRPPSVERVLAVVRERLDGTVEPGVLRGAAREVVDGERARLGAGDAPRDVTTL